MKVLIIGSDKKLLDKTSAVAQRTVKYGEMADQLFIINFTKRGYVPMDLSAKVQVYPTNSFSKLFYYFDAIRISKRIYAQHKIDVISTQDPFEAGLVGLRLKRKFKTALNVQIHGDFFSNDYWVKQSWLNRIRLSFGKRILPQADSVRAVSQRIAASLIKLKVKKEKITVAPIFVDRQKLTNVTPQFDLHKIYPGRFIILSVGRLVKEKNLPLLIRAFKKNNQQLPRTVLLIVGSGPDEARLKKLATSLNLNQQVIFKGWQDDLASYYKTADLLVVTSNSEGYNRTVIEAMACGLPVIMTNVGLAGEVIINNENGLVISQDNEEELINAITKLINNQQLREQLATRAKLTVQNLPSADDSLKIILQSWQTAVNHKIKNV